MRILVTGGAGFIGSHLVDALVAAGHAVHVLDSLEPQVHGAHGQRPDYLNPATDYVWGDIRRDRFAILDVVQPRRTIDGLLQALKRPPL